MARNVVGYEIFLVSASNRALYGSPVGPKQMRNGENVQKSNFVQCIVFLVNVSVCG